MVPKYQNVDVVQLITENSKFVKIDPKSFFSQISAPKLPACYTQVRLIHSKGIQAMNNKGADLRLCCSHMA